MLTFTRLNISFCSVKSDLRCFQVSHRLFLTPWVLLITGKTKSWMNWSPIPWHCKLKRCTLIYEYFRSGAIFPYTKYPVISSQEGIPVTQLRNMVTYCKEHYFQDCVGTQFDKARLLGVATNCLRKFKLDAEVMEKPERTLIS